MARRRGRAGSWSYSTSFCSGSSRWTRQARHVWRAAIDDGRGGAVGQRVAGDLILPGEPDILLSLRIGEEAVEDAHPACVAGDAIVQAHHHHAPPPRAFLVKLIELIAQRLLVGGWVPVIEREGCRSGGKCRERSRSPVRAPAR